MKTFKTIIILGIIFISAYSNSAKNEMPILNNSQIEDSVDFEICTPEPINPLDGVVGITDNVSIQWSGCGKDVSYELQISTTSDFKQAQIINTKDSTYLFDVSNIVSATIFWKVRTVSSDSKYSFWSLTNSFSAGNWQIEIIMPNGCHGNCATCPNPCGRGRSPIFK